MKSIAALLVPALFLLGSCAGGGGSVHVPPESIHAGKPTTLTVSFTVWGAGFGRLSRRYTDIRCHYRIVGSTSYSDIPMVPVSETSKRLEVQGVIPPLPAKAGDQLEYYFDEKFDGVYNKRVEKPVPFD